MKKIKEPDPSNDTNLFLLKYELSLRNILIETADTYSQGNEATYKICQDVVDAISKKGGRLDLMKEFINKRSQKISSNIDAAITLINKAKNDLVIFETNLYTIYNKPYSLQIIERCKSITAAYSSLIRSSLAMENYDDAKKYNDELDVFYNKTIKSEYTIQYTTASGELKTEKLRAIKIPDEYVYAKNEYFDTLFQGKNESQNYEELKDELKKFSEYSEGIPHSGENDLSTSWHKTLATDLLKRVSMPYTISNFRIENSGKPISLNNSEIYNSESVFKLKFRLNGYNTGKAIEANLESSVSKRPITLKFRQSSLFDGSLEYYATFTPIGPDTKTSLIKKHGNSKDELKHTVCTSDANPMISNNPFYDILNSDFFKDRVLGKGIIYPPNSNDEIKINTQFLENMGFENIVIKFNKTETSLKISNQADWFIAQGHGTTSAPEYQISLLKGEKFVPYVNYWIPKFLKNFKNKNLDFVIFGVCHMFQEPSKTNDTHGTGMNAIEWQNLLGNKVAIMGYSFSVYSDICSKSMKDLVNSLAKLSLSYPYTESDKEKVIIKWLEIHRDAYNLSVKELYKARLEKDMEYSASTILYYETIKKFHTDNFQYARWATAIFQKNNEINTFYKLKMLSDEPSGKSFNNMINSAHINTTFIEINENEIKY
jgi:hypothetical protein